MCESFIEQYTYFIEQSKTAEEVEKIENKIIRIEGQVPPELYPVFKKKYLELFKGIGWTVADREDYK